VNELVLTGLDGKNPLGFLAALGVLDAATRATGKGEPAPTLAWRSLGTYRPVLAGGPDREGLLALLAEDLASFRDEPAIALRYPKGDADGGAEAHDLKPRPERFAAYLRSLVDRGARRSLDLAAAFATDVAVDNNGNAKPTALHFTAGQQEFLRMVGDLAQNVAPADLEEAVFGPWRYARPLPVLGWDGATSRDYALRATDPSKDKKLGVPGADWLAFRGLPFVRVAPVGDRVETTGCHGGWKTGAFRWPLWTVPLTAPVVRSLLSSPEVFECDPATLSARGVDVVLESGIRRSDQGGYGSFTPARVAEPAGR
jgi:hypothetical protein